MNNPNRELYSKLQITNEYPNNEVAINMVITAKFTSTSGSWIKYWREETDTLNKEDIKCSRKGCGEPGTHGGHLLLKGQPYHDYGYIAPLCPKCNISIKEPYPLKKNTRIAKVTSNVVKANVNMDDLPQLLAMLSMNNDNNNHNTNSNNNNHNTNSNNNNHNTNSNNNNHNTNSNNNHHSYSPISNSYSPISSSPINKHNSYSPSNSSGTSLPNTGIPPISSSPINSLSSNSSSVGSSAPSGYPSNNNHPSPNNKVKQTKSPTKQTKSPTKQAKSPTKQAKSPTSPKKTTKNDVFSFELPLIGKISINISK